MAGNLIRNSETIADIFRRACERRELLILVTPYLRFESAFVKLEGKEFHVAATMGREDATYGLRNSGLKVRFPHGISFLEAPTELKGFGMHDGRRTLRLAVPDRLQEEDHRSAYRVDRVGRIPVTFSTPKYDLIVGTLVDLSTTGSRIYSTRDFLVGELVVGEEMAVTIQVTDDIRINAKVKLRHVNGRTFGVEFRPQLEDKVLNLLSRWVFEKREEDMDRISRRGVETAAPAGAGRPATGNPSGLLLVSADADLEGSLQNLLGGLQPVTRIPPTITALKDALNQRPSLVLYHVPSIGLDERRRIKTMAETIQGRTPFMLLGTSVDGGALLELGNELKAAISIVYNPERGTFFQRLVQGVLRRTYEGGESPMAPKEKEETGR